MRGVGSPSAWHTKEATPPDIPIWSSGALRKLGMPETAEDEEALTEDTHGKTYGQKLGVRHSVFSVDLFSLEFSVEVHTKFKIK